MVDMTRADDATAGPVVDGTLRVVLVVVAVMVTLLGGVFFAVLRLSGGSGAAAAYEALPEAAPPTAGLPVAGRTDPGRPSRSTAQRPVVDPAWVARISAAGGIPAPALRAYAETQLRLAGEQPGCHLGWNTLAGIGWIESHHGTIGDRVLGEDGRSSTPILGPALDGSGDVAAIRSTPTSASWHGDPTWDHAVGPLQFLSSTWDRWGADGDADGVADPRDLDDAALAAGRYLCADGHDLAADGGWNAAVHSYNHDAEYVAAVAAAANSYTQRTSG